MTTLDNLRPRRALVDSTHKALPCTAQEMHPHPARGKPQGGVMLTILFTKAKARKMLADEGLSDLRLEKTKGGFSFTGKNRDGASCSGVIRGKSGVFDTDAWIEMSGVSYTPDTNVAPPPRRQKASPLWKEAWGLYSAGHYDVAMLPLLRGAEAGNFDCMETIAYMHDNGQGVKTDHMEAVRWYRRAADLGDQAAMRELVYRYTNGFFEIQPDPVEARCWSDKLKQAESREN